MKRVGRYAAGVVSEGSTRPAPLLTDGDPCIGHESNFHTNGGKLHRKVAAVSHTGFIYRGWPGKMVGEEMSFAWKRAVL